jgi:hypothetical protein
MQSSRLIFSAIQNEFRKITFPATFIFSIELITLAFILLAQAFRESSVNFTNKMGLGYDYQHFYGGAQQLLDGKSPYVIGHYVTPPVPALLNVPIAILLKFNAATYLMFLLIPACLFVALWWTNHVVNRQQDTVSRAAISLLSVCALVFGYPFLFLISRENIDGFVLLAVCAVICLLPKRPRLAGFALAFAISLKLYPVLLILPLLVRKQWKALVGLGLGMLVLFLVTPPLWMEFITSRVFARAAELQTYDNVSLTALFYHLTRWVGSNQIQVGNFLLAGLLAGGMYLVMLALMVIFDLRASRAPLAGAGLIPIFFYIPFMIAIPQTSYQYEAILLLALVPVLCAAWNQAQDGWSRVWLLGIGLGIGMTQILTVPLNRLVGEGTFDALASSGLLIVMLCILIYQFQVSRRKDSALPISSTNVAPQPARVSG